MVQGFSDDDLYLIDMSYLNSPAEFVYDLTSVLDNEQAKNKRIKIKIGAIDLNQAQLMSIKSLILSINSSLVVLDGTSEITRASALATGIVYENSADMVPTETAFLNEISENSGDNTNASEEVQENQEPQYAENVVQNEEVPVDTNEKQNTDENVNNFENEETVQPEVSVEETDEPLETNESSEGFNFLNVFINNEEPKKDEESETNAEGDTSSSIPESSVIQEELSVIYGTEKKLEDVFESTGIKEEKFVSFKDGATAEEREYTKFDFELESFPTKYLKQNICAGQVISFDGNLVIIGDCHEGSEISASGDITVWGNLSGSAYAGMNGNEKAKIRALRMNASQLRISTCYIKRPEALETPGTPKQPLVPEEASIIKGEIGVYKIFT